MTDIEMLNAENARLTKLVIELRAEAVRLNAQAVPDGWKLVPVDPTDRMLNASSLATESEGMVTTPWLRKTIYFAMLSAAPAAPQPAPVEQTDARDAARWRYIAWHIGVAWNEQGFTSLVRIVSDKHREMLGDMVDRMMAGDWPEAAPQPAQPLDLGVMELAESVGLIGPASRTDDLHEAIQRFHDLIVVNASIKAARHFADGLAKQPLTDEHKAILKECRNQAMKWTAYARIPEAGAFGGIAQDLDYLCGQLGVKP